MRYGLAQHERVTFYLLLATRPLHPEASPSDGARGVRRQKGNGTR